MLAISSAVSIVLVILAGLMIDKIVTNPVKRIVRKLYKDHKTNEIIRFSSSEISEVDTLTEAIEKLQVNVRKQASRV